MPEPAQQPGKSKQDYTTPRELLTAVKRRLHIREDFCVDLAASKENAVCDFYYSEEDSAFDESNYWHWRESEGQWAWCNPPFADISPWVEKAAHEAKHGANIVMLIPASVGSNWWRDWVEPYAYQVFLNGRLTFGGCSDPYPKDTALLLYTSWGFRGTEVWDWKK